MGKLLFMLSKSLFINVFYKCGNTINEICAYLLFVYVEKLVECDFATNWILIGLICWLLIVGKNVYTLAA